MIVRTAGSIPFGTEHDGTFHCQTRIHPNSLDEPVWISSTVRAIAAFPAKLG